MIRPIILISLFLLPIFVFAQKWDTDSLKSELKISTEKNKIEILIQLADQYLEKVPDSNIYFATKAKKLAEKYNQDGLKAKATLTMGSGYIKKGNLDSAKICFETSLKAFIALKDSSNLFASIAGLGIVYSNMGNYQLALDYQLKALKYEERTNDVEKLASSLNELGTTNFYLKNYNKALEYYQKAYEKHVESENKEGINTTLHNIGIIFQMKGKSDSALLYFEKSLAYMQENELNNHLVGLLSNMGTLSLDLKEYDKALHFYKQALNTNEIVDDKWSQANILKNMGDLYMEIGELDKAKEVTLKSLKISSESGAREIKMRDFRQLALINYHQGAYRDAYEAMRDHSYLQDSIFNENIAWKTSELQTKYETEKKEREITQQALIIEKQKSNIKQQWLLIGGIISAAMIAALISFFIFFRYRSKQKQKQTELEKKSIETEQRLLRSQMNPHFIFNSLNSVQKYITTDDKTAAMSFLLKFAELIRNLLANSRESSIPLQDEVDALKLYIELEKIRSRDQFQYEIHFDEELDPEGVFIPPMLVQPFVENAIKHGLRHKNSPGNLSIDFRKNKNCLYCSVRDDGVGREGASKFRKKDHKSLALEIISERLEVLKTIYNVKLGYEIIDLKDKKGNAAGTEIVLTLPFETE